MTANEDKGQKAEVSVEKKIETVEGKLEEMEMDLSLLLREGHTITTAKGDKLIIPALTGRTEKEAIKLIIGYLRKHSDLIKKIFAEKDGKKDKNVLSTEDIVSYVIDFADDGYDVVQQLVSILVGKDVKWANNNLLLADLVAVVIPFIKADAKPIVQAFRKNMTLGGLGKKIKNLMDDQKKSPPSTD